MEHLRQRLIRQHPSQQVITLDFKSEIALGTICDSTRRIFDLWGQGPLTLDCDEDYAEKCDIVFEMAYHMGNTTIFADEFDMVATAVARSEYSEIALRKGRSKGVSVVGISQRPADVPRSLTSSSTYIYIMGQNEPNDLIYFAKMAGIAPEELQTLPEFEYFLFHRGHGTSIGGPLPMPTISEQASRPDILLAHEDTESDSVRPHGETDVSESQNWTD